MIVAVRVDIWRLVIVLEQYSKDPERHMGVTASISGGWFIDKKDQHPTQMKMATLSS